MPTTSWTPLTTPVSQQTSIATTTYPAQLIAQDTFSNGTAGALVTDRSGEQATWNKHPSYTSVLRLSSASRAYLASTNSHGAAFLSESTGADYRVRARLRWLSAASAGIYDGGIAARMSPTADTMYLAWWQTATQPGLHLYRGVAGVFSDLTSVSLPEPTIGTDYDLELQVQGSRITAIVSGGGSASTIAATDSGVTLAGRGGLRAFNFAAGGASVGLHMSNVLVDTFASTTTSIATTTAASPPWTASAAAATSWQSRGVSQTTWNTL